MEKINKKDLHFYNAKFGGSYAEIWKCFYDNHYYAYKAFYDSKNFSSILKKIESLSEISLNGSIMPKYGVIDSVDKKDITYLTRWSNYHSMCYLYCHDNLNYFSDKIKVLKNIRNNIIELHDNGIIHGDIHMCNVLVNQDTLNTKLIDFDNCNYKSFNLEGDKCSDIGKNYVKKYGINEGLDIFLLNHLTISLLYNISSFKMNVELNYIYGEFIYDKDVKHIIDTLLFMTHKPSTDFLVDTSLIKKLER